jgi:hypothetical protein
MTDPLGLSPQNCKDSCDWLKPGPVNCLETCSSGGFSWYPDDGLGYDVFDAIAGAPGTSIAYDHGRLSWSFSLDEWQAYYAAHSSNSYRFNISNPDKKEQQKQLAAILLGEAACDGQSSSAVTGCIQDAYNTMGNSVSDTPVGGNYNFTYLNVVIQGSSFDPGSLGCFMKRCGSIDSLHFHKNGTFHVDTANPWGIPVVGATIHLTFDYIGGHTWWSAGIPRPWWH